MSFLKATWDSICSIGKRSSTPGRADPTQDPPRGASPSPTLPQYFDAWDDISWDILSETPLGETDESIYSPPPLYEDTMASIPSFSQEVRQALNSGSTTDLWLYSRKSPSPPLDDAEDHLSTISYHGYSKFLDGTTDDTHLQIVRKSYDNSSMIPYVNIPDSSIVERVHYGSHNGDLNNITQGPTKSHSLKRQREDDNPRSEPPKRKRMTSPPTVSPNHNPALSGKIKVDDNDDEYVPKYSSHRHPSDIASSQPTSRSAKRQRIDSSDRCRSDQDDGAIEKDHNEEFAGLWFGETVGDLAHPNYVRTWHNRDLQPMCDLVVGVQIKPVTFCNVCDVRSAGVQINPADLCLFTCIYNENGPNTSSEM
ncbi:hypothetical protein BU17DRAFT_65340 [Hysterangium stoloniferum]|nr:hypothetical protein BU17DRAFT_65340 [Hysterangium stoloniferum]